MLSWLLLVVIERVRRLWMILPDRAKFYSSIVSWSLSVATVVPSPRLVGDIGVLSYCWTKVAVEPLTAAPVAAFICGKA